VAERVGNGVPLKHALAAEGDSKINVDTWKKALVAHPEFRGPYEAGKGKFLEYAMRRLAAAEDLKFLCWLLERRHSDLFSKPEPGTTVNVHNQVNVSQPTKELSDAELERIAQRGRDGVAGAAQDPQEPQ
jgi:hypothetical protein